MALSEIPRDDQNFLKVVKSLISEGPSALLSAFEYVSDKDPAQSFKDFFLIEKQMPNSLYTKRFNKDQREKMESDPLGKSFDVSLLFLIIKLGSGRLSQNQDDWKEGNDSSFESNVTMFKNLRNFVLHLDVKLIADDGKMMDCLERIQKYLEQILRLSAQFSAKGKLEVDDKVKKMKESIQKIKESEWYPCDSAQYKAKIKELREAQKQIVEKDGVSELKQEYKILSSITPVSSLSEIGTLDVQDIYRDTEAMREMAGRTNISPVDSKEILVLPSDCGKKPKLIIVEGDAGAGKSTLAKLIVTEWAADVPQGSSPTIKGIKSYDLILYSEFRNHNISSVLSLLKVLLPQTSNEMDDKNLIESVCGLNTLVILDGWDEVNEASNKLMRDLLDNILPRSKGKMELLITTRPNKLPDLPSIHKNMPKLHIRLTGVRHGKQLEFVRKLHEEMRKKGQSTEQTEPLVEYVKCSSAQMGEHFSLPLNLALVTYLWATDPNKVNSITTATELYTALQDIMKLRLIERLQKRGLPGTQKELDDKCEDFLKILYRLSFETHASGSVELNESLCQDLEDKCKELQLPPDEMCSTFLNVKKEWTPSGYKLSIEAPHKSILEFFAALDILFALYETPNEEAWKIILEQSKRLSLIEREQIRKFYRERRQGQEVSIQSIFEAKLGANLSDQTFGHFQESMIILGGLLTVKDPQRITKYGQELVHMLDKIAFRGEDMKVQTAFRLSANMKNNDVLVEAVVNVMMKGITRMVIQDGHCTSALAILKHWKARPSLKIVIDVANDGSLIPELQALLAEVSTRDCKLLLHLDYHWRKLQDTSDIIRHLFTKDRRCRVVELRTHLEDPSLVPPEAKWIHLGLSINNGKRMVEAIRGHERSNISIHLSLSSEDPSQSLSLTPLPTRGNLYLFISDVTDGDTETVVAAVRDLQPLKGEYYRICFPRSSLTRSGTKSLLRRMGQEGLRVGWQGLRVSSPSITTKEETKELKEFSRQHLQCRFDLWDDETIWSPYWK